MRQLIFILLAIIGVSQAQTIQYIGAPTTTVISRGNFRTDSIFYLPKRTKLPTDTAALRYQISDSSLYAWTGSQWRKVGADGDTLVYSTRAWRQKGDDSLAARINLKVNISDTASMLAPYLRKADTTAMLLPYVRHAGYGLTKSGQSFLVDTLNIATRAWRQKGLDSLAALEVSGSGTTNYVAKFTAGSTIGNSQIFDNGTSVGINATSMAAPLSVFNSTANTAVVEIRGGGGSSQSRLSFTYGTTSATTAENGQIFGNTGEFSFRGGSNRALTFYTNPSTDTERLRIFANGRVFVGASPTDAGYQLDINGTLRSVNGANFATTSGNVGIGTASPANNGANTTTLTINGTSQGILQLQNAGTKYFELYASGTDTRFENVAGNDLTFRNGSTINVRITSGGNVGIGTTTAGGKLTINSALGDHIQIQRSGQTDRAIVISASDQLVFGTWASPTQMALTSAGELLINTTTDAGDYKLQVSGNIYNTGSAVLAATSGNVGVGSAPSAWTWKAIQNGSFSMANVSNVGFLTANAFWDGAYKYINTGAAQALEINNGNEFRFLTAASGTSGSAITFTQAMTLNAASELLVNTTSDAGDYKLQVVGNARIGTGKLDIASNTTFGLGVARSGTSEVAGQIYNSNGILYLGAESSAGGQIFSGSSAYAAVIGSGAAYPLQFAANNITRATLTTNGNFMIGFPTDTYFYRLQVNGSIFSNNQIIAQNAAAQLNIDSSTNISPLYISNQSLTGSSAQGLFYGSTTWNTTGNPSLIDLAITNTASGSDANYIKISDGSNIFRVTKAAEVVTAAPTGGSIRKWKLGEAATVSPTSPNRTIRVEIDGTVYYLHAKTTND